MSDQEERSTQPAGADDPSADLLMTAIEEAPDAPGHLGGPFRPPTEMKRNPVDLLRHAAAAEAGDLDHERAIDPAAIRWRPCESGACPSREDTARAPARSRALDDARERRIRIAAGKLAFAARDLIADIESSEALAAAAIALARFDRLSEQAGLLNVLAGGDLRDLAAVVVEAQDLAAGLPEGAHEAALRSHLLSAWVIIAHLRQQAAEAQEGSRE